MGEWIHIFLTSALAGNEWSVSRPGRFTIGTHWRGGLVDPTDDLDKVDNRKFLVLSGLKLRSLVRSTRSQSLYRLSYPGLFTRIHNMNKIAENKV
jgi:hypothetical protein